MRNLSIFSTLLCASGAFIALTPDLDAQVTWPDAVFFQNYGVDDTGQGPRGYHMTRFQNERFQQQFGDPMVGETHVYNELLFRHYRFASANNYTAGRTAEFEITMGYHDWNDLSYTFSDNFVTGTDTQVYTASQVWGPIVSPLPTWEPEDWGDNKDYTPNGGIGSRTYVGPAGQDDQQYAFPFYQSFLYDEPAAPGLGMVVEFHRRNGKFWSGGFQTGTLNPQGTSNGDYSLDGNGFAIQPGTSLSGGITQHGTTECFRFGYNDEAVVQPELLTYGTSTYIPAALSGKVALYIRGRNLPPTDLSPFKNAIVGLNVAVPFPTVGAVPGGPWAGSCQLVWIDVSALLIITVPVDAGGAPVFDPATGGGTITFMPAFIGAQVRAQGGFEDPNSGPGKFLARPGTTIVVPPPVPRLVSRSYTDIPEGDVALSTGGSSLLLFQVTYNMTFR